MDRRLYKWRNTPSRRCIFYCRKLADMCVLLILKMDMVCRQWVDGLEFKSHQKMRSQRRQFWKELAAAQHDTHLRTGKRVEVFSIRTVILKPPIIRTSSLKLGIWSKTNLFRTVIFPNRISYQNIKCSFSRVSQV